MKTAIYRRNLIKAGIFLVAGLLLLIFVLEPVQCHAQAEINPDHYDTPDTEPISQAGNNAKATRSAANFHGSFTLPFDVRCAGTTLSPGSYSVSIRSAAKSGEVTLMPSSSAVPMEARVMSRSNVKGPSALVLERSGRQRTLTAIRLKELGIILYLEAKHARNASADAEAIPIS